MLQIGQNGFYKKKITSKDIKEFASVVGDMNPIHIDERIAQKNGFDRCIAHGMLTGSLISATLGTVFPGEGTIYLEQNLKFLKAVYEEEVCTAIVTVEEILNPEKGIYKLKTVVTNGKGEKVIDGYAVVKNTR